MFEPNHCSLIAPPVGMLGGVPLPHHNHHTMMPCSSNQLPSAPPRSSRNTEKRRERSKVAARCRRGKESEIFTELSQCLPVPESSRSNLDKASVMRLTLCDLKLKEMIESIEGFPSVEGTLKQEKDESFDSLINSAVSGFVLVCSLDGDVIYVSEGISTCLGLSQYEVMGQSLLEYSHPCDHADVKEMLVSSTNNKSSNVIESRSALFRMKSANSTRGRNVHHRSANYKVVSCFGRLFSSNVGFGSGAADQAKKWFVGICEPLLHPSDVDIPLNKQTFLSKHSPDMKFEYVDESISEFMGYNPDELVGKSLFDFYHACDGEGISRSFRSLYTKGQTVTERTRFLAKGGGWIWVLTQATTINNNAGKPTSVVCIHFVASGVECEDEIVSHVQLRAENEPVIPIRKPVAVVAAPVPAAPVLQAVEKKQPLQETTNLQKETVAASTTAIAAPVAIEEITPEPLLVNPFAGPLLSKPTPITAKIFAPRTDDMDTGFLMPVNDTLIVTKEEPADLTHLAPIAGDECVPIQCNVPLLDDLLQWLDAADMEYQVMEGYEEPLPHPLISAATCGSMMDSPIPIPIQSLTAAPVEICPITKDDVVMDSMSVGSDHTCESPLLLRSTDPTLLSSTDPLLLSPFKTSSPEPMSSAASSPAPSSRMDFMSSDIFSTFYSDNHGGQNGGSGTAGASSHKSKAGGGYDDESFSGFPIVSDFQEILFSPGNCLDETGPPASPPHLINIIDGSTGGLGTLKIDVGSPMAPGPLKVDGSTSTSGLGSLKLNEGNSSMALFKIDGGCSAPAQPSLSPPFGLLTTKQPDANVGLLQYITNGSPTPKKDNARPLPPEMDADGLLPSKIAKISYPDDQGSNKPWIKVAGVTPTQPPWRNVVEAQTSPLLQVEQQSFTKRPAPLTTIGTQTMMDFETTTTAKAQPQLTQAQQVLQQRQRQLQKYRELLMNPVVLQALLLNGKLMTATSPAASAANSRKRNFVGKLLSNGGLLSNRFVMGDGGKSAVSGTANLPGAGFLELPSALVELTNQDCEVNAPLTQPLLDGPDLITALDTETVLGSAADCV